MPIQYPNRGFCSFIAALLSLWLFAHSASAEFVVTYRGPESPDDNREHYNTQLIKLALDKSTDRFGPYRMQSSPSMNRQRQIYAMSVNMYPNLLVEEAYEDNSIYHNLRHINFPIDLGVTGYRICFVAQALKKQVAGHRSLDELRQYTIAQGSNWKDVKILRANNFSVQEINNYDSIFKMTAAGRVDLFCRGINELPVEVKSFKHINGLVYDESFALIYPLPRFFYTHADNTRLIERMEYGFNKAWQDGSLRALWLKYNRANIEASGIKRRKLYYLDNPFIKKLPKTYAQYQLDPLNLPPVASSKASSPKR